MTYIYMGMHTWTDTLHKGVLDSRLLSCKFKHLRYIDPWMIIPFSKRDYLLLIYACGMHTCICVTVLSEAQNFLCAAHPFPPEVTSDQRRRSTQHTAQTQGHLEHSHLIVWSYWMSWWIDVPWLKESAYFLKYIIVQIPQEWLKPAKVRRNCDSGVSVKMPLTLLQLTHPDEISRNKWRMIGKGKIRRARCDPSVLQKKVKPQAPGQEQITHKRHMEEGTWLSLCFRTVLETLALRKLDGVITLMFILTAWHSDSPTCPSHDHHFKGQAYVTSVETWICTCHLVSSIVG